MSAAARSPETQDPGRAPWSLVGVLSVTETVSWGILYYAFAVLLVPMQEGLGLSAAAVTGAFSLGLVASGVAGIFVGRFLDGHGPRALMTAGSAAGAALVVAWSQVEGALGLYTVWLGIGLVMAAVLYEPAFAVLAKGFGQPGQRRAAMTLLTLAGATASLIFMPVTQLLAEQLGWRSALLALALILGAITVPLHAVGLRRAARPRSAATRAPRGPEVARVLGSLRFRMLTGAFFLASLASLAAIVHAIPFLIERGYGAGFAAFAVGLVGLAQIPGRLLFLALDAKLTPAVGTASVFGLVSAGIALLAAASGGGLVVAGLVMLGIGNGMTTLARANAVADEYGAADYGAIAGVLAAATTAARAAGPVSAAVLAAALGYPAVLALLALLAAAAAVLGGLARGDRLQRRRASTTRAGAGATTRPARATSAR